MMIDEKEFMQELKKRKIAKLANKNKKWVVKFTNVQIVKKYWVV